MPIADIVINGHTYDDAMWRADWEGTISAIANDIATVQLGIDAAGMLTKAISGNTTLSGPESQNILFVFTGTLTADAAITFAAGFSGIAVILNQTAGGFKLTCGLAAGATVEVLTGGAAAAACDGTDFVTQTGISRTATGAKIIGDLLVTTDIETTGDLTVGDLLTVNGNASFAGTLNVDGAVTFGDILGAVTLSISGNAAVGGTFGATGNITGGGTLGITGAGAFGNQLDLTGDAATPVTVNLDSDAGQGAWIRLLSGGVLRWVIGKNVVAEGGGNAGAGLEFVAYSDAGAVIGNILTMNRDGTITLNTALLPTSASGLVAGTVWNNASNSNALTVA